MAANKGVFSHVYMWTGYHLDETNGPIGIQRNLSSYPSSQQPSLLKQVLSYMSKNVTVGIITDSSGTGPNYRLFLGGYINEFSHARRFINPDQNTLYEWICFSLIKKFKT